MRVIERTEEDMQQETVDLFNEIKPLLDEGKGFYEAIRTVKNISTTSSFANRTWYKRVREYAISQGYKPLR